MNRETSGAGLPQLKDDHCVILVAEDDVMVRNFLATFLTEQGFWVLSAADGVEALDISREFHGRVHLLVTDVKMPRMGGLDLSEAIKKERPDIKILVISGKLSGEVEAQTKHWAFMRKPFLPRALMDQFCHIFDPAGDPVCYQVAERSCRQQ
jgi:DNA-binding NtrC family response regulator